MCFAPQRRTLFRHRNSYKCSWAEVFCTFWLRNVLRAVCFVHFDLEMCLTACNFSSLIWPAGDASASLLSTLRGDKSLEKHSVSRLSCLFAHLDLLSSETFSFLIFFLLSSFLFSSLLWLFPSLPFICQYRRKFDFRTFFDHFKSNQIILYYHIMSYHDFSRIINISMLPPCAFDLCHNLDVPGWSDRKRLGRLGQLHSISFARIREWTRRAGARGFLGSRRLYRRRKRGGLQATSRHRDQAWSHFDVGHHGIHHPSDLDFLKLCLKSFKIISVKIIKACCLLMVISAIPL